MARPGASAGPSGDPRLLAPLPSGGWPVRPSARLPVGPAGPSRGCPSARGPSARRLAPGRPPDRFLVGPSAGSPGRLAVAVRGQPDSSWGQLARSPGRRLPVRWPRVGLPVRHEVARFLVVAVTRLPVEPRSPVRPGVGRLGAVRCPWGRSSLPSVAVRFLVARFLVGAVRVSWLPSARHEVARNRRVARCPWGRPPGCSLAGCPGPF